MAASVNSDAPLPAAAFDVLRDTQQQPKQSTLSDRAGRGTSPKPAFDSAPTNRFGQTAASLFGSPESAGPPAPSQPTTAPARTTSKPQSAAPASISDDDRALVREMAERIKQLESELAAHADRLQKTPSSRASHGAYEEYQALQEGRAGSRGAPREGAATSSTKAGSPAPAGANQPRPMRTTSRDSETSSGARTRTSSLGGAFQEGPHPARHLR